MNSRTMDIKINSDEAANIEGLICSLRPENICLGMVLWSGAAKNIMSITSSNEVINANSGPEIMPGRIRGKVIL